MRKLIFLLILMVSISFSRDWFQISGKYATVEYPKGQENVADSLLEIAELSIPKICKMAGVLSESFENEKAHIVLTDAIDLSNGYALGNSTVIFSLSSSYLSNWTGTQKWYEQVLTHELVHVVTFRKLRRKANIFGALPSALTPRWFWEGVAQYFSEPWNAYRGDLYLKNAVLDGKLTLNSMQSLQDGRLLYATGNAFVRYLADQHGDSSLIKLMSYNEDGFIFDFDAAFQETYKESVENIFPKFVRHLVVHYGYKMADYPRTEIRTPFSSFGFQTTQIIPLYNESDSTYLVSAKLHQNHNFYTTFIVKIENKKVRHLRTITDDHNTRLVLNQTQDLLAYGKVRFGVKENIDILSFDWFVQKLKSGVRKNIIKNIHARYAAFTADDILLLVEIKADISILHKYDLTNNQHEEILKTKMPLGRPVVLENGDILLEAQNLNGNRDIFIYSNNELTNLTNDATDDRRAVVLNDSLFIFNRYENENPALAIYNLNKRSFKTIFNEHYEYWTDNIDTANNSLILAHWEPGRRTVFSSLPLDSVLQRDNIEFIPSEKEYYSKWTKKKPAEDVIHLPDTVLNIDKREKINFPQFPLQHGLTFALPTYSTDFGWGIFGLTSWFEMLQRQGLLATFLIFPENFDRSFVTLAHVIRFYNLNFSSLYYHGPVIFSHQNSDYTEMARDLAAIDIGRKFYISGNERWVVYPSFAFAWNHFNILESSDQLDENFSYNQIRIGMSFEYFLPTRLYPLLPKKQIGFHAYLFQSLSSGYDYNIYELGLFGGTNLILENLGIKSEVRFLKQTGNLPPLQSVGIDRFYETNIPRDFGFTRPVRGVREYIGGSKLLWSSSELIFLLAKQTPLKLLFFPINNLAISGFFDFARITSQKNFDVYGYGGEITFGDNYLRFGAGYAIGKLSNDKTIKEYYLRLGVSLPQILAQQKQDGCLPENLIDF